MNRTSLGYYDDSTRSVELILFCVKYFCVFAASAVNPLLYGYAGGAMRRAFAEAFCCCAN